MSQSPAISAAPSEPSARDAWWVPTRGLFSEGRFFEGMRARAASA